LDSIIPFEESSISCFVFHDPIAAATFVSVLARDTRFSPQAAKGSSTFIPCRNIWNESSALVLFKDPANGVVIVRRYRIELSIVGIARNGFSSRGIDLADLHCHRTTSISRMSLS